MRSHCKIYIYIYTPRTEDDDWIPNHQRCDMKPKVISEPVQRYCTCSIIIIKFHHEFCLNSSVEDGSYERANTTLSSCGVDAEVVACASTELWKADEYEKIIMSLSALRYIFGTRPRRPKGRCSPTLFQDLIVLLRSCTMANLISRHQGQTLFQTRSSEKSACGLMCHDSIVDRHSLRVIPKDIPRSVGGSTTRKVCITARVKNKIK